MNAPLQTEAQYSLDGMAWERLGLDEARYRVGQSWNRPAAGQRDEPAQPKVKAGADAEREPPTMRNLWLFAAGIVLACPSLFADVALKSDDFAGVKLYYKVIVPKDYDPAREYPAVIAFPGGEQNMPMVDGMIARNLRLQAEKRGYIVVVCSATAAGRFYEGGAVVFPAFLDKLLADYKIRGGKFHIAGISNGGLSSFHIAASYPKYFWSVTGFPGYLTNATEARVDALRDMCLNMHVGELDRSWLDTMQAQAATFRAKGMKVRFTVERGQGHVMTTLEGAGASRLFDQFDEAARGCGK
jgi:predicted esterase